MIILVSLIETLIISVLVFLVVILLLVAILLYARKRLTPQGDVTITINNEKEVRVRPGSSVLTVLSNSDIFLPSACGGGGTCGLCRCQITEGGGSILPTEVGFFTRKEQHDNWRLGCQVKVRQDMKRGYGYQKMGV